MIRDAHATIIEVAARPTDHPLAVLDRNMTQRARDPHPRLTIDVDEDHRARHAAVGRRPQPDRRADLLAHLRSL